MKTQAHVPPQKKVTQKGNGANREETLPANDGRLTDRMPDPGCGSVDRFRIQTNQWPG